MYQDSPVVTGKQITLCKSASFVGETDKPNMHRRRIIIKNKTASVRF